MSKNTDPKPRFFLLDGHAMAYRAYYGMLKQGRRFQTRQGVPTGATYGFARLLLDVIKNFQPHLLAVCFDLPDPTHRHEQDANYKVHRKPPPDDLILQFPYIQRVVRALGIPLYEKPGYEADDLLGTLGKKAVNKGYDVSIITGDRDLFQLIEPQLNLLMPNKKGGGFESFNADKVAEKYGYTPEQVIDYKALAGDSSDNIPGVKGIGDKSAISLLSEYGTLDNIYANLDNVASKFQKKLETGKDDAYKSQKLATILIDAPVNFEEDACKLAEPQHEELIELFKELEFNSLLKELPTLFGFFEGEAQTEIVEIQAEQTRYLSPDVQIVSDAKALKALVKALKKSPFAFDTETTGLDALNTKLVGLSFALPGDIENAPTYYVPVGHTTAFDVGKQLPIDEVLTALKPVFEGVKYPKCGHNIKFDMHVLSQYDIHVKGVSDDTMLADYLVNPANRHGLKELTSVYLEYEMQPITDLIGKGRKQKTMDQVALEEAATYAGADAVATMALQQYLRPQLKEKNLTELYEELEIPLLQVLAKMEQRGVTLDTRFLKELSQSMARELESLTQKIQTQAGEPFNLNSPKQLSEILFEKLGLPTKGVKKTKTSGYSTDVKVLEKLAPHHTIIADILDYRQLSKLTSTYIDALPQLINPKTGRVHTSFHQAVAATGRLSSSNPNLQNIPIRTDLGRQIRKAFVPSKEDHVIASFDYSQIELRLLAHFSEDPIFIKAFKADRDIHSQTAMEIFNLTEIEQVTSEMRRIAKTTNFGIVYGQSAYGLANVLNISNKEAQDIIARFKERYHGIEAHMQKTLDFAREHGYVETLLGRRRDLTDINHPSRNTREFAERMAVNTPLQGSASDLIKKAMIVLDPLLETEFPEVQMLIQVHDELVFEIPKSQIEAVAPKITSVMENVHALKVPLKVDLSYGANWMEAK